jgi:Rod binding domain-containing protein
MLVGKATASLPGQSPQADRAKVAAQDFEALLIAQMLRSAREDEGSSGTMMEYAEQQVAQLISASGGLGLAGLVERGLAGQVNHTGSNGQVPRRGEGSR